MQKMPRVYYIDYRYIYIISAIYMSQCFLQGKFVELPGKKLAALEGRKHSLMYKKYFVKIKCKFVKEFPALDDSVV